MQTKLVTLEVSLLASSERLRTAVVGSDSMRSDALRSHIQTKLTDHGLPLRWAITDIDSSNQTARVEAIITNNEDI